MPKYCCVPQCKQVGGKSPTGEQVSFHKFPNDKKVKKRWLLKIKRVEGKYFKVTKSVYVCSNHFIDTDYRKRFVLGRRRTLKDDSVPSRFPWSVEKKVPVGRKPPRCRNAVEPLANIPKYKYPPSKPKKKLTKKYFKLKDCDNPGDISLETELIKNDKGHDSVIKPLETEVLMRNQTNMTTGCVMKDKTLSDEDAACVTSDKFGKRDILEHYQDSEEISIATEPAEYIPKLLIL